MTGGGAVLERQPREEVSVGLPIAGRAEAREGPRPRVFVVERDDEAITCNSPQCIARLLRFGWRLADPSQSHLLAEALAAWERDPMLEEQRVEHRRRRRPRPRRRE
jgi:hypothetical protein